MGFGSPSAALAADDTVISDPTFAACINEKLGRGAPHDQPISESDAARITTTLACTDKGIVDLDGAQHLTSLPTLNLSRNSITDASVLGQLTNLTSLSLDYNPELESIDFVSSLTRLWSFSINGSTKIGDNISALRELPNLSALTLNNIGLSDLSQLAEIGSLESLSASNNAISDVTPLDGLSRLSILRLESNEVSDFSALRDLPLTTFNAGHQWVTGATLFVPSGATSYIAGTASSDIIGRAGQPASIVAPDEYSDDYTLVDGNMTFTVEPTFDVLRAVFSQLTPSERFFGHVNHPIAWSDFTSASPAAARAGEEFSHAFVVTDGFPTEAISIANGEVPGLTLSEDGILTGVPTAAGSYPITVSATDANGNAITTEYRVEVAAAFSPPLITTTELAPATVGSAYDGSIGASGLQPMTFAVTAGSLPAGLRLGADGAFSGTPEEAGDFAVTITATNADGADDREFIIVVADAAIPPVDLPGAGSGGAAAPVSAPTLALSGAELISPLSVAVGLLLLGATVVASRFIRVRRRITS